MGKELALYDSIVIDGHDISTYVNNWTAPSTNEVVDDSGFSVSGNDETLSGKRTQSITLTVMGGPELHQILYHLHRDRSVFTCVVQPAGLIDATREKLSGNGILTDYPAGAARGQVRQFDITINPGDASGFAWIAGAS